jgi:putative DNA primase/helicase
VRARAALAGARVVSAGEPDEGVRLSESVIKSLTGEDEIEACKKYENPFTFTPHFKLWLHTNHKPEIRGTDAGIWRRPRLIPFNVSFEGRADLQLDAKLDAERPGILAWAVEGAREWYSAGLGECTAVSAATKSYREEEDVLGAFIADRLKSEQKEFLPSAELYAAYERWCKQNGAEPWQPQTFSKRLRGRGYILGKHDGVRGVLNVRLLRLGEPPVIVAQ